MHRTWWYIANMLEPISWPWYRLVLLIEDKIHADQHGNQRVLRQLGGRVFKKVGS